MKTKLLKQLRKESWNKYEVKFSNVVGEGYQKWCIYTSPNTCLAYEYYSTKEAAVNYVKSLWHDVAEKYLWEHRTERKRNKYPW